MQSEENIKNHRIGKQRWKVTLRENYSKYFWEAKREDDKVTMKSWEYKDRITAMNMWEGFAIANRIKCWVYINKN